MNNTDAVSHAFEPDAEDWGWYDPLAMQRTIDFVQEWNAMKHPARPWDWDARHYVGQSLEGARDEG